MAIVPVVPSSSDAFDTLIEAALAESPSPTSPRDETPAFRITSPLPPIFQHFLRRDLEPTIPPAFPAALRSNTFAFHGALPTPSHIQPILRVPEPGPLALLPAPSPNDTGVTEGAQASITVSEHASFSASWSEWENSFTTFMAFFDGGAQILRSADELLPLCHQFNGYAPFRGALVYPETVAVLGRFMDKYGDLMDITGITSSFSRSAAFRTLGLVLHGMDTMQLLDITDHRLLCWRDAICEALTLGFRIEFLLNLVKDLARAVFGERAIHSMESFSGSEDIRAAIEALILKQRELENQHRELRALLLAQDVSSDSAGCIIEAVTRSSQKASSIPF